ncbi:putative T7SS-secreted protein [Streptomyces sp. NPDC059373]
MSWGLNNLGDALEGAYDGTKKLVGEGIDTATDVAGGALDTVGLHSAADAVEDFGDRAASALGADVAEQQLGQSEEPKELVHGDAEAIRRTVKHLRKFHAAFENAHSGLSRLDTAHWTGKAADAFREKFDTHPKKWLKAADACGNAADALDRYADTITWAQQQAKEAVERYRDGQKATEQAVGDYNAAVKLYNLDIDTYNDMLAAGQNPDNPPVKPAAFTDPGTDDRQAAQDILNTAREQRDSAARDAQAAIAGATELAPAEPSFAMRLLATGNDKSAAMGVELEHGLGGIVRGAADLGRFARSLNPMDPYNLTHPAEWMTGMNLAAAGLVTMAAHPERLPSALVGTGWGSDPSEAGGRLGFNILTAILTDGAGTAATAGERTAIAAAKEGAETVAERSALDAAEQGAARSADDAAEGAARRTADEEPRNASRENDAVKCEDDPVDIATGRVLLPQTDVRLPGALPLLFSRKYESSYRSGWWMGRSWASTADQRLEIDSQGVVLITEDGHLLDFPHPVPGVPTQPREGSRWLLDRTDDGYTVTDPDTGHTQAFASYDENLALIRRITDRHGRAIDFEHDSIGTPLAIRHHAGYHLRITTQHGRITALHLAGAGEGGSDVELIRYGYTDGRLTEVINSSRQPLVFGYDDTGRITSWTDRNGSRFEYVYDEHSRCISQGGAAGHLRNTYDYDQTDPDTGLRVTTITNSLGHTRRRLINDALQVVAEIDELGNTTRTTRDRYDRVLSRTDPLGRTVTFEYDEAGRPATITRPDGNATIAAYNDLGLPTVIRNPDGTTSRQTYDATGNRTSGTGPDGATTHYAYDEAGNLAAVTDPLGNTTRVRHDSAGLPVEIVDPLGAVTRYLRDGFGRVTSATDPLGNTTRLTWTIEGKLSSRTAPDGTTESWTYDGEGNVLTHTNAIGGVTRSEYTHFDLLTAQTGPDGVRHTFTHDTTLQLRQVTNPQGLTWTYDYDPAGRLISETDFDARTLTYVHDEAGQLVGRTNALGQTTSYAHDVLGNVITKTADSAETSFTYDEAGRLLQATSPEASLTYQRDRLGRITAEACNGRTLAFTYDDLGRRTARTTPTGAVSGWTYDAAGNRTTLTTAGHTFDFEHDAAGREIVRHFGDVVTLSTTFDALGRQTAQSLTADTRRLQHRTYTYRADGNLMAIDDDLDGSRTFDLDAAGRVTTVHARNWTERYAYDDTGNQTDASWPTKHPGQEATGTRTYTGTRITHAGRIRYEHDAQGRITLRQKTRLSRKPDIWRYTWDAEDRLTTVTTPDGTVWRYIYDPLGRRIAKQRLTATGDIAEQTHFTWDGPTLAEQTTGSPQNPNPVTLTWDHDGLRPLAQTERITAADVPQQEVDSRFFAIITDLVGTPTELVDETGRVGYRTRTTLWGATTWTRDSTAYTPLRFPGQYFDPETGLHYNFHRYYDPETARYTTPDPLGLEPAPNPAAYVHNPHTWTDPLGLSPCSAKAEINPRKLDYLYNKDIAFDPHNTPRAIQNDQQLSRIGLRDSPESRAYVSEQLRKGIEQGFEKTFTSKYGTFGETNTLIMGPFGGVQAQTTWQIMPDGTYRFSTSILHGRGGGPSILR